MSIFLFLKSALSSLAFPKKAKNKKRVLPAVCKEHSYLSGYFNISKQPEKLPKSFLPAGMPHQDPQSHSKCLQLRLLAVAELRNRTGQCKERNQVRQHHDAVEQIRKVPDQLHLKK